MRKAAFCICENKDADQLHGIVCLKIDENRYKQKISTDPYFGCYSYAVFSTKL